MLYGVAALPYSHIGGTVIERPARRGLAGTAALIGNVMHFSQRQDGKRDES